MLNYTRDVPPGKWSGEHKGFPEPPAIGTRVRVTMNRLGTGTVIKYFEQDGWVGLIVWPDDGQRPGWHIEQFKRPGAKPFIGYHVFGSEIAVLKEVVA